MLQSVFLLVLLGTAVSSQQQHEDKHQQREVEPTQRGQPLEQPASQDEQHPTELRPAPQENERPQLPDGENEPPPPPPSPQSQPQPQQENQQHQGTIDEEQRQREERLLGEQEQQPPSLEPMPDALPSQADHQQQPTMQSQKDSEHQHSGGDSRAVDLPHPEEQTEGEEDQHQSKTKTVEGQEGGLLQQEFQEEGEAEEVKEAGMRKEEVMEEEMIEEEVKEEGVEEEEMREEGEETEDTWSLPSDLPTLHWHETARLIKCCPPEEALVHRPGGGPPACEPSPSAERWQPLLLNGRSGRRTPPDARSQLASGNLSCSGQHFWLDSTAGDGFELLTTGHLYLRRADALMAPLSFCADRLFRYTEETEGVAEPPPARVGRAARVCTLSLQERRSLLDETALMPVCARRTCLRKCCPRGLKVRWREDQLCVPQTGARPWRAEFQPGAGPPPDYHTVSGNPPCRAADGTLGKVFTLQPAYYDDEKFLLREDGRLWVPHSDTTVDLEDFCVDQVEYEHPQQPGVLVDYHAAIVCFPEADGGTVRVSAATYVYRALVLVSALFLLATLVVYCSVPELRNLHGRCLLSHVAALLAAYSCNLAAQLAPIYSNTAACQITALVMYFSFLAACFWLNVMSFDIWLTFSRIRSAAPNRSQTGRFIKYSLYCWCCPLVLTAVVIVMQFVPDHLVPPENFIRPRLGELKCWFAGGLEMLVYFHVPLLLLMTANLVFFTLTIKNLLQTEKDTRMAGRQKKGIERFKIYVNIFIVMGVTWIVEALSVHIGPKELWSVTDVFNALQGFFIFLLFTLRQNTRNIIRKHFAGSALCRCCPRAVQPPGSVGTSSRKTRSTSVPSGEGDSFRHHSRRTAGEGAGPAERAAAGTPLSPVRETAALCDESETEHASPANGRSE